ncbi:siderophore-interacting protein [Klenkia terrae]|uniref:siderophore-interacting protein n=1 Tax=Klenkia terrae TaxID=1052259 RepID=UPI00360CB9F7
MGDRGGARCGARGGQHRPAGGRHGRLAAAGRGRDRRPRRRPHPGRGRPRHPGLALLEVAGPAEEQPLVAPPGVEVRWLHRGDVEPGASTLLVDAVAGLDHPGTDDVFAWVGAESAAVRAVRADLRGRWGLGRTQHHAIGYWRRGRAMSPAG